MQTMNPETSIPPMTLVKRLGAKGRWHLVAGGSFTRSVAEPLCGQRPVKIWRSYQTMTAYNAAQITCYECLSTAISRKLSERGGAK